MTYGFLHILVHTLPCIRYTFFKHSLLHTHTDLRLEHFEAAGLPHQARSWEGFFPSLDCFRVSLMTVMHCRTAPTLQYYPRTVLLQQRLNSFAWAEPKRGFLWGTVVCP